MAESKIFDLELMPDNDYFVVVTANDIQIRRTEDGEIFKTYPGTGALSYHDIEFTSDSSQLILAYLLSIEFRNLNDLSLINKLEIPSDSEGFSQSIMEIKVDPIRNYIYALVDKIKYINGQEVTKRGILIINSKNFEDIKELTTSEDRNLYLQNLAVSKDGKYLAVSNEGSSKLIVWSLETQKKVNEYQICPTIYGTDIWGIPSCIKFSELNSDKIYISGEFSQNNEETDQHSGLFIYSISENKIIDSTFGVGSERIYGSKFTFFEKENKAMATNGIYLYIINYKDSKIEYKTMLNANIPIYDKIIYNNTNDYFISYCEYLITKVGYKNNTSVVEKIGIIDSVYPNPTTNDVIVKFDCEQAQISYKILNINSKILAENTAYLQNKSLTFDFSSYSAGVYFIQLTCENLIFTYKIIKDN